MSNKIKTIIRDFFIDFCLSLGTIVEILILLYYGEIKINI